MKNKSIIPNIIGMVIISILLIFGASRCSGPVPQAGQPDTTKESAAAQTASEAEETEPAEEAEASEETEPAEETETAEETEPAGETETAEEETEPVTLAFVDVPETEWYRDSVAYVFSRGLMNGVTEDTFAPNDPVSRGMLVTILHRMAGAPAAGENTFSDVTPGFYYEAPIAWAAENSIVNGYSETSFGPEDSVTREQMATILYRYAKNQGADTDYAADLSVFADRDAVSDYAVAPFAWANAVKLINGVTEDTLEPQGQATRAQMATIIMRYIQQFGG